MDTQSVIQHLCTESCCADGDDNRKIKCSKCKRFVHYTCTNLPIYQLRLFYTKNYRGFICVSCVEVPADFKEILENQSESMIDTYKREIQACESIMVQKNSEEKFISGLKNLKEEQKAAHQEKDLGSLLEKRFNEVEKNIDGTQTLVEEMKKSGEVFKLFFDWYKTSQYILQTSLFRTTSRIDILINPARIFNRCINIDVTIIYLFHFFLDSIVWEGNIIHFDDETFKKEW